MDDADGYDYVLPAELIAQQGLEQRDQARLLVVHRESAAIEHRRIEELPDLLAAGDLLVANDSRVVPARILGRRAATGGRWEGLFLRQDPVSCDWQVLAQTRGRPLIGERVVLIDREGRDAIGLRLVGRGLGGTWLCRPEIEDPRSAADLILERIGRVPLPGYIRGGDEQPGDIDRYQTVFARQAGSAAAPTAGLHFTTGLLQALESRGVGRALVTLHVGIDTFRPITASRLDDHLMHSEWCECPAATADAICRTKAGGGRVVAVGTTAVRTLETAALRAASGEIAAWAGSTDLFIRPGWSFRAVDCMLTNFHMPRTTLMVLVTAFAGRELIRRAYDEAIRERYRFLSYGDAMLIM